MLKKLFFLPLFLSLLGFGGCAVKRYEKPHPALIVLKTPKLKYADQGFVYRGRDRVKVQVYASGKAVLTLTAGRNLCIDGKCMEERRFDEAFLGVVYPEGTMRSIFLGRPIFGKKGLQCSRGRCEQRIDEPGRYDIIYAFDSGHVRFKDRKNHILIKMTEIR
ncbi:hypothetical protein [Hydrogenimonas sp. SS33]|uniref:hypothetical protein n=1 Tax=Hydrogenimonas leucolamina TaxID=2954236 RepID=UPI00336BF703